MPATVFLAAANLVPLLGVLFWGWDAFELLVLYWCETAVITFWFVVQVGIRPDRVEAFVDTRDVRLLGRLGRMAFFTVHAGIFMSVHMMLLWDFFSGAWAERVHGPADFVRVLILGNGVWVPLLLVFIVRGATMLAGLLGLDGVAPGHGTLRDLYGRIITMHLTVLLGAFAIRLLDSRFAPALLIALKTAIELFYDPFRESRTSRGPVSKGGVTP